VTFNVQALHGPKRSKMLNSTGGFTLLSVQLIPFGETLYAPIGDRAETPAAISDLIVVGVFSGQTGQEKPLSVRQERITGGKQTFTFTVNEAPTRAGIDPFNKLIDRNLDDNSMDVSAGRR
jgi:ABC-2 type transport system permease protein